MLPSIHVSFSAQSACAALVDGGDGRRDGRSRAGRATSHLQGREAENLAHLDRDHVHRARNRGGGGGLNMGVVI